MADYTLTARLTADARQMIRGFGSAQDSLSNLQSSVASAGDRINAIGKTVGGVGGKLTKGLTLPAVGAASALAGIALAKGWSRLTGIDNAQAKLKGLGHDAESVSVIMSSALDAVRGTAFGMDEAATTAAGAVAAGIKPGKELTKYLGLTGDAAAIAGVSLSEMGSVINKVQTSQVAYTDNLNQLADRGIPIYKWLADEAGVAQGEVAKMASDGKISSEMFLAAIENNIGGAAKVMGESSFTAAISNIGASMGRIGANFLDAGGEAGGFFSTVKPLLTDFNNSLGSVEAVAADLGVKFGEAFNQILDKARELKAGFDGLSAPIQDLIKKGAIIGGAIAVGIGPALVVAGLLISGFGTLVTVFAALISPVGLIIAAIVALGVIFVNAMMRSEDFRNTVMNAFTLVRDTIMGIVETLTPILQNMWEGARAGAETFASTIGEKLFSVFEVIKTVVLTVVDVVGQFVSSIVNGFGSAGGSIQHLGVLFLAFNPILKIAMMVLTQFGPQIAAGFMQIASLIVPILTTLGTMLGQLAAAVIPLVMNVISTLIPIIVTLAMSILQIITAVLPVLLNLFMQLVPVVMSLVQTVIGLVSSLLPLVSTLIGAVVPILMMLVDVILNIVQAVAPALIAIIGAIIAIFQAIIPVVMMVLTVVIQVVAGILAALLPIIAFVAGMITSIIAIIAPIVTFIAGIIASIFKVIAPIVTFVAGIFNTVFTVASGIFQSVAQFIGNQIQIISNTISLLSGVVSGVFNSIWSSISTIMDRVRNRIQDVFNAITNSWEGLKTFVSSVFTGIGQNMEKLVGQVKGFVNGVIRGVNSAISVINMIPGVSIGKIPQLARGTDNWQGGFARMNEGGRGEMVMLPSGTQVIPHDVSMKYAREAGQANARQGATAAMSPMKQEQQIVINPADVNISGQKVGEITFSTSDHLFGSVSDKADWRNGVR